MLRWSRARAEPVVEAGRFDAADLLVRREEVVDDQQQVVEIDGARDSQGLLVTTVAGGRQLPGVVGFGGKRGERRVGPHPRGLPAADAVEQVGGAERGLRHLQFLENLSRGRFLLSTVDDRESLREPDPGGVPPQDANAQRMDRGDFGLLRGGRAQQLRRTCEHLPRRLVGERDGQDA